MCCYVFVCSVLSSCVHAVVALLYPFSWQHTFIPVLPSSMVDIVCCPTPFLVGILSSSLPKLKELPVEEVMLILMLTLTLILHFHTRNAWNTKTQTRRAHTPFTLWGKWTKPPFTLMTLIVFHDRLNNRNPIWDIRASFCSCIHYDFRHTAVNQDCFCVTMETIFLCKTLILWVVGRKLH